MQDKKNMVTRRKLIGNSILSAALLGTGCTATPSKPATGITKKRAVRFAHLTDIHMEPKKRAPEGLTAALKHIENLPERPDMIITGGDNIMDALGADDNYTGIQFALLKQVLADHTSLPVKYCIGNHDVWGWNKEKSKTTGDESLWGKQRAIQEYNLPDRYYGFDQGSWRILILDSISPSEDVYTARLDDEQFKWLSAQLAAHSDKHICMISHIPIMSAVALLDGDNERTGNWVLPHQWMHLDARRITELFVKHKNVKLCISGHLHLLERIVYNDVTYICDGAVSGSWWGGAFHQTEEGYGLFDLYEDGTFNHQYIDYGWKVEKS